ncbi:MAG: hypothetical protein ACRDRD_19380, partial [Pseudonocardiaceae bacterium]
MTTIPLRPEHATRVRRIAGVDQRLTIRRILTGYAYPENGNVHNPTPRYQFLLQVDGVTVDTATLERVLRQAAKDNGAAYLAEMDQRMVEAAAADGPDGPFARQITERYHQRRAAGQDSYQAGRVVEASPGARGEAKRTAGMTLNQLRARLEELDADELLDLLRA